MLDPCIEDPSLQLIAHTCQRHVFVNFYQAKRFQSIVIPLIEGPLEHPFANFINRISKVLKFVLTVFIKCNVFSKISKCNLFPCCSEKLNVLEYDLRNNQFSLPVIVDIHVSSFPGNIFNTIIKCTG